MIIFEAKSQSWEILKKQIMQLLFDVKKSRERR